MTIRTDLERTWLGLEQALESRQWRAPSLIRSGSWKRRHVVLALLALVLVWQVVTTSMVAYLAERAPRAALWLRSEYAAALLNLAEERLEKGGGAPGQVFPRTPEREAGWTISDAVEPAPRGSPSAGERDDAAGTDAPSDSAALRGALRSDPPADAIRASAERALLNDPLNARALRILGRLSEVTADEQRTAQLMQAAAGRSLRESAAAYWMMQNSYETEDYEAALRYADALLRTRPQEIRNIMPTLTRIAEHPDASAGLKRLLAGNPPWRSRFFEALPAAISDARTPLDLLLSLKDTPVPPTTADLRVYLNFLIRHKFHELAYYTWLQFLPAEQLNGIGFLFNGSFERAPTGLPFDWVISPGSAVTIDIAPRPDQRSAHALFIEFGHGRVEFRDVTQLIALGPGSYRLQGSYKGEVVGRRGLQWRVACADGDMTTVGESLMFNTRTPGWEDFAFSFTVPDTGCPAQSVRLTLAARSASEQFVSGSIWYDELRIVRDDLPADADRAKVPELRN
jgi:hypothetical protein